MNKNRLMKTASVLLASIMTFGLFAFVGPVSDVLADEEYSFNNIKDWPWQKNDKNVDLYQYAVIDGVKWCAIGAAEFSGDLESTLPSSVEEKFPDCNHYVLKESVTVVNTLNLSGAGSEVTLDLNGNNLSVQCSGQILNLQDSAIYNITDTSGYNGSIFNANGSYIGGSEGGYFSVSGSAQLRISDITISGAKASSTEGDAKGGAVYVGASGRANFTNVNITACNAINGKGSAIYVAGGGTAVMTNMNFNLNGNGYTTKEGAVIYCESAGTVALYGTIETGINYANSQGDLWFNENSSIQIGSSSNQFTLGCSDYTLPYYGVFSIDGGSIAGITCANSDYILTEEGSAGYPHIASAVVENNDVTLAGASATLNAEVNGLYYPVAFNLVLNVPSQYQVSGYKYVIRYNYEYKNQPREEISRTYSDSVTFDTKGNTTISIGMNPALMANELTWEVIDNSTSNVIFTGTVDPLEYISEIITKDSQNADVAKALVVMGVYAEKYFYKTETLKDAATEEGIITTSDLELSVTIPATQGVKTTGFGDGVFSYYGASMILNADGMTMRQYVLYNNGAKEENDNMFFFIGDSMGAEDWASSLGYKTTKDGSYFYMADKQRIKMLEMETPVTFMILDRAKYSETALKGTIEYSVLDYISSVSRKKSSDANLVNYLKSMYALYTTCKAQA